MDTMDNDTSTDQQKQGSATTVHNNYHAPVSHFHYHFHGSAPNSINCSSLPLLQSQPQESLPAVPKGAICIDNRVVFGPPKQGQVTRMIEVEGVTKLWICDDELRDLYGRMRSYLNQRDALLTDPLLESSTVLQHIFLSPEPKCQGVCEALTAAQDEVSSHLLEKVQSFEGKETELGDDMTPTGPGPMLPSFLSYTLAYLQRLPAEIFVRGQTKPAPRLVCEVREWGIRYDLSGSFKPARYIEAPWSQLPPLHNAGIWFSESCLPSNLWSGWFSTQGVREFLLRLSQPEQDSPLGPNVREEDSPKEDSLKEDSLKGDSLKEDSLKEDSLKGDSLKEGSLKEDSLKEDSLTDGVLVERFKDVAQQ
jgi:hypothetical protein